MRVTLEQGEEEEEKKGPQKGRICLLKKCLVSFGTVLKKSERGRERNGTNVPKRDEERER